MHYVALALLTYCSDHNNTFPSGAWLNTSLSPDERVSWYAEILPYLDRQEWHDTLEKTSPWHSDANAAVAGRDLYESRCPIQRRLPSASQLSASYIGVAGIGREAPSLPKDDSRAGVFGYERQTTRADIKDGLANTMLIAETARVHGPWLQGGSATIRGLDPANQPYIGPGGQFGGLHVNGGANVAFADGSVRVVSKTVSSKVFEAFSTIAGGERVRADWNSP
jgi:prepilin-type processing-associated H-X9-DG protein